MAKEYIPMFVLIFLCVYVSFESFWGDVKKKEKYYECRDTLDEILPHVRQCIITECERSEDNKDLKCRVFDFNCARDCNLNESITITFDDYYYYEVDQYKERCYYFDKIIHYGNENTGGPNYIKWD